MDQDFRTTTPATTMENTPLSNPLPQAAADKNITVAPVVTKEPLVPYLASVTALVLLLISTFYSLFALIDYALSKLLIKEATSADVFSGYTSGLDNYVAVGAFAAFLVSLPAVAIMALVTQKYESSETWRLEQKWRRVVYIVGAIALVTGIVGVMTSSLYTIMSTSLNLDASSYTSYMSVSIPKNQDGNIIIKAVLSGLTGVLFLGLGLFVLGGNYANRHRWATWATCGLLLITGLSIGGYDLFQVSVSVKKIEGQAKSQSSTYGASGLSGTSNSSTYSASSYYENVDRVQEDLKYYADDHQGLYPTKEQWDNGDFISSGASTTTVEFLKSTSYTPSDCTATGCKSYSLKGKDSTGVEKTVTDKTTAPSY